MENKSTGLSGKKTDQSTKGNTNQKGAGSAKPTGSMSNAERKYRNSVKFKKQQRQKYIKKVSIISAISVVVIAIFITAFYFVNQSIYGHIMTVDGKKVSTSEFKLMYTANMTNDKQATLDMLTEYWVVEKIAAEKGLSYTESEKETALSDVPSFNSFLQMYGLTAPKVSDESYIRILGVGTLYNKLRAEVEQAYVIDEEKFAEELADYIENGKQYYIDTQLKYVIAGTQEAAEFARGMLETGMEVDEVIINYSEDYNEETGITLYPLSQLGLGSEDVEKILALEVAEYSEVIDIGGAFAFFIVDSITIPSDEDIEESFKQEFNYNEITKVLDAQIDEWTAATNVVVNQKAFDSVK